MDNLKLIFGDSLSVKGIEFRHPKIKDIVENGENFYMSTINLFTLIPSDFMVELYECGKDFRKTKPFEIFILICMETAKTDENGKIILDKHNEIVWKESSSISKKIGFLTGIYDFRLSIRDENLVLYSPSSGLIIDEGIYNIARYFYCKIHFIDTKDKYNPANDATIKFLVKQEKRNRELRKKRRNNQDSGFSSKVSALVWSSGISYENVREMYVYQFYDGLSRIRRIKDYDNICHGFYSGNIKQQYFQKIIEDIDWAK